MRDRACPITMAALPRDAVHLRPQDECLGSGLDGETWEIMAVRTALQLWHYDMVVPGCVGYEGVAGSAGASRLYLTRIEHDRGNE